jgi:cytochrome c oxidase assembly factor CtaG
MTALPPLHLADAPLPPLHGSQLFSTEFDVVPVILILGALALYLFGVHRVNRLQPRHPWSGGKTLAFILGLVVTGIAIFSFIGVYDGVLFWDHMVQHLLLIMVAAPLFAMGSPIDLAWRSTSGRSRVLANRILRSRTALILGHPLVAFGAYAVVIPITHLTSFYNYVLLHETVHNFEHLVFLGIGYLFWRQIFGSDPNKYRMYPGMQILYLSFAIPVDTFTGLSLNSASHELFPAYLAQHRTWGPSLLSDLHMGGVIMWVGGDTLMFVPLVPLALRWLHLEERRAVRVDRQLDAMLPEDRGLDLPSTPKGTV